MNYFQEIQQMSVNFQDKGDNIFFDTSNQNYVDGLIWKGLEQFPEQEFFHILHDSMLVNQNLDYLKEYDFTSYMFFNSSDANWDDKEQRDTAMQEINTKTEFMFKEPFVGLFGITFSCKRWVLEALKEKGLNNILPTNKLFMQRSERIWGMCLEQLGIDIKQSSIAGNYFNRNPNPSITKFFAGRQ